MESLARLDRGLDFHAFSLPPPPEELSCLFLGDEGIGCIDEAWWEDVALASPDDGKVEEETGSDDSPVGVVRRGDGAGAAPSSSCSSPAPTLTSDHDDAAAVPSESGTKRSAVSSPEYDQEDPKRARRLEKNREAASQSRARKKSYVKELEVKCRMLEAHVAQLQRVMTVTSMENSALKDELVRVKKPKDSVKTGVAEPAVGVPAPPFMPLPYWPAAPFPSRWPIPKISSHPAATSNPRSNKRIKRSSNSKSIPAPS